ncbi:MAG TPA: response regulator [Noviherbaspirillum sp.]
MSAPPLAPDAPQAEPLVQVLAPFGQDAQVITGVIEDAGAQALVCDSVAALCARFGNDICAMVLVEEALESDLPALMSCLRSQPPWSDIPIVLLSGSRGRAGSMARWSLFNDLGNATVLERPLHQQSFMIAIRAALRGRAWQRVVRGQMAELRAAAEKLEQRVRERTDALYAAIEEREHLEQALAEARRLEAIGRLTGGVAHDFNNILQVISLSSTLLGQTPALDAARRERAVQAIQRAAQRGAKLTHQLLAFARRQPLQPQDISVRRKLLGMRDDLQQALEERIRLSLDLPGELWNVRADPTQLEAALLNLAINAREAMQEGGALEIRAQNARLPSPAFPKASSLEGEFVIISVSDTGPGMPPEIASQAFEPFFTTRKDSGQAGLGLSQVYGFATQSGGAVWIGATAAGAAVSLALPRSLSAAATTDHDAAAPPSPAWSGLRVLCVEDNDALAEATTTVLQQLGCQVGRAACAEEALAQDLARFDLVFSDVSMPGRIDGIDMATLLARRHPGLPVVLCSGYMIAPERLEHAGAVFLAKPYTMGELQAAIAQSITRRSGTVASESGS